MRLRRAVLVLVLAATACGRDAQGDEAPRAPCPGCTIALPPSTHPIPLLVVLHGNDETSAAAAKRWRGAARARGWGVLGLQCPAAAGCDDRGRWYRWRGDPGWVFAQVDELRRRRAIDRDRIYLAGWSGGATYIGMMAPRWERVFAAVVFHGGGTPPRAGACPRALPAYFLVGDENPAHPAAKRLRAYWRACEQPHVWDLQPGANHAREDAALDDAKAATILGWLERHARRPVVGAR